MYRLSRTTYLRWMSLILQCLGGGERKERPVFYSMAKSKHDKSAAFQVNIDSHNLQIQFEFQIDLNLPFSMEFNDKWRIVFVCVCLQ